MTLKWKLKEKYVCAALLRSINIATRCGTEVSSDGRPVEYRCGRKRRAVLSNYKADVHEAWQFENEMYSNTFVLVVAFTASFSNFRSSKSHHRPTVKQHLQIFAPQNIGDRDRWWRGVAVTSLGVSTRLLYVGPG